MYVYCVKNTILPRQMNHDSSINESFMNANRLMNHSLSLALLLTKKWRRNSFFFIVDYVCYIFSVASYVINSPPDVLFINMMLFVLSVD